MQHYRSVWVLAFAALAAVASCEGARWREPAPAREPTRTVLSKDCRSIITIETPSGPDGAVAWHDRLHIVLTDLQPWHLAGVNVPDPDLRRIAVVLAKSGSLTNASCPLPNWTEPPRQEMTDRWVVFSLSEVLNRQTFERELVVADVLPRGGDYALQLVNCENFKNYTYSNGTAAGSPMSALSLQLEVSTAEMSRPALLARVIKSFLGGHWGRAWDPVDAA